MRAAQEHVPLFILTVVMVALLSQRSNAQPGTVRFHHLGINDGLSQSSIKSIVQDSIGFLWFGTEDGLNKYDGYSFTVFRHDAADSFSISDNYIWKLLRSRTGDLWIGTLKGGLNRYEISTGRFIAYRNSPNDSESLSNDNVPSLFEETSGVLWVGTWGGGLCRLDPGSTRFVRYRSSPDNANSLSSDFVSSIGEDDEGSLWVGTSRGLTRIDSTRTRFTRYSHSSDTAGSLSDETILSLYVDRGNNAWIGTRDGLNRYERGNATFTHFYHDPRVGGSLSSNIISCLLEDSKGNFWVGTHDGGICQFDRGTNRCIRYTHTPNPSEGPITNAVLSMYEDNSGTVWFGTAGGVSRYDRRADKFIMRAATPDDPNGLVDVRGIRESRKGGVWVGLNGGGVAHFDFHDNTVKRFRSLENDPHSLSSDKVLSVLEQRDGTLWVGTLGKGLNRLPPGATKFIRYQHNPADPGTIADNTIMTLLEDSKGVLWVGTELGGLDVFDPVRNVFLHHKHSTEVGSISGNWIWSLYEDTKGNIWVGTWTTGLNRFDRATNKFETFIHNPSNTNSLGSNSILSMCEDTAGVLWLGTLGGGLEQFDPTTRQFTHHTEKDGLGNNVVPGVLADAHGNLWLSTYKGISRFTPSTGNFQNYDASDGLQSSEFNQGAYCELTDGTMFFGGVAGLNYFHPDSIRKNTFVPPVEITGFNVFDEPLSLPQPAYATDHIGLRYTQNFFSFNFVALNYTSSSKNEYVYKLEGLDKDWVNARARRIAYYTNVPPGRYVFRVRGSNNDGAWNNVGAQVDLVIAPPFWGTWWFRILFIASVVLALFMFYRRRVHGLERERRIQQQFSLRLMESQEGERKRIAGELHDSLGQNLLVIRNRALLGLKNGDLSTQARDQLDQISSVATQAIDEVRGISYNLRPYQLDRLGLTKAILSITSGLATSVRFSMNVEPIDDEIGKDQAIHVYRIVQEGINNILKHATASEAQVVVRVEPTDIRITINDNGKGVPTGQSGDANDRRGFGLVGISERAKVLDGSMTIDSTPGKGTTLTVLIPRSKKSP